LWLISEEREMRWIIGGEMWWLIRDNKGSQCSSSAKKGSEVDHVMAY